MRKIILNVLKAIDLQDVFAFGGLAMAFIGLHAIYPPAALIVIGAVLFRMGAR
ncbi:MAG: hypothetical protein H6R18_1931 [Proteobacteria bacterium]|nr:hypothetical protein [Pseudomonadota bacterium]